MNCHDSSLVYEHNFARVTKVEPERVELAYDLDHARWPWLALPAQHPVLIEKYQYFGVLSAVWALGVYDPKVQTALTQFEWTCLPIEDEPRLPTLGVCTPTTMNDAVGFDLTLGSEGQSLVTSRGGGFAFTDRDFPAWRKRSREKALAAGGGQQIDLAPPEDVGLDAGGRSFVSRRDRDDDGPLVRALVPTDGGFYPAHPFHTGSGDHVNAAQLFDCALQAAQLVCGEPRSCRGGGAAFTRFVELDVPFELHVDEVRGDKGLAVQIRVRQLDRDCGQIRLEHTPSSTHT